MVGDSINDAAQDLSDLLALSNQSADYGSNFSLSQVQGSAVDGANQDWTASAEDSDSHVETGSSDWMAMNDSVGAEDMDSSSEVETLDDLGSQDGAIASDDDFQLTV